MVANGHIEIISGESFRVQVATLQTSELKLTEKSLS